MFIRDPGEKDENFKAVTFAIKSFLSMQNLRGVQWCYFNFSVLRTLAKKTKTFGRYESFEPIDLKFGIDLVHTCMTHKSYFF